MATDQQRQGDYNPEYMEQGPNKTIGGADHYGRTNLSEFEVDPAHPTSPSSVQQYQDGTPPYVKDVRDDPPGDTPGSDGAGGSITMENDAESQAEAFLKREAWLVAKAQEIYTTSTDYMDANITNQWERNLSHFNNEHAPADRLSNKRLKRSRIFRPKTRTMTKSHEAALTNAMFTTQDVIDVQAEDSGNMRQVVSAQVNKEILQYRLDRRVKWFQTTIGAYQSTKVYGLCISFQYWDYHVDTDITPAIDKDGMLMQDENGNALGYMDTKVRRDELRCDLIAPENFRFDPMCDWRDPCNTSPYLVYMMPVYVGQAMENMEKLDPKTGQPVWRKHSMGSILATRRKNYDRTRQAREGRDRIDPADEQHGNAYTMLWAHMNIVTVNGDDILFWTMGTELLLTEPMLLKDAFPHLREGERPFVVGFSTIEAFRNYPAGDVEQSATIQQEINTIANQRLDNVKLALNKRYYVKRGSQVDLDALIRNVPGGGVMMNDPEGDVKTIETKDITSSSYAEQDRLSTEMDELVGNFSQQSVQQTGNRKGGETKGGMDAMRSGAGAVQDYGIKIFVETWAEPTLRQMVRLEQMYETDAHIISLAGRKAQVYERFGVSELTDELLREDLTVRINVGMNNTDPQVRIEKLLFGVQSTASLPGMGEKLKSEEVTKEIFGMLGYKDGTRFYRNEQEQAKYVEENPPGVPMEVQVKQEELKIRDNDNKARHQREVMKLDKDARVAFAQLALEKNFKYDDLMAKYQSASESNQTTRDVAAASNVTKMDEHRLKRQTGSGV